MRPSNMNGLEEVGKEEEKEEGDNEIEVECPHGTVPIRRTTKEDLIRQKTFNQMFDSNIHPVTDSEPGLHVHKFSSLFLNLFLYINKCISILIDKLH